MPFLTNDKNFRAVMSKHLRNGENLEVIFGAGRRVVALTDARLLVSTFPFFFSPKLLVDAERPAITGLDKMQAKSMAMDLVVNTAEGTQRVSLPTSYSDVNANLDKIFEKVRSSNPSAGGASYFEPGEQNVASIPVKEGSLVASDRNLYVVARKPGPDGNPQVLEKLPWNSLYEVDVYQSKMNTAKVGVVTDQGPRVFSVPATFSNMLTGGQAVIGDFTVTAWPVAELAKVAWAVSPQTRPSYLQDGETVLCSVRAGRGMLGGVSVPNILRLTDQRVLDLKPSGDGRMALEGAIPRDNLGHLHVLEQQGEHGNALYHRMTWTLADGNKIEFVVPSENEPVMRKIVETLGY